MKDQCMKDKQKVHTTIETQRSSIKSNDASLDIKVEKFVKSAKYFTNNFYLECDAKGDF